MNALMDILSKSSDSDDSKKPAGEGENASGDLMNPSFEAASSQAMEALQNSDSAGFADALRACIDMAQG